MYPSDSERLKAAKLAGQLCNHWLAARKVRLESEAIASLQKDIEELKKNKKAVQNGA